MEKMCTVKLNHTVIRGTQEENGVFVFRNVPFAKAERWKAPQLIELEGGEYDATSMGAAPFQGKPAPFFANLSGELLEFPQSEDCLNINLWMGESDSRKRPVLFWTYGGAYIFGYNYRKGFTPENFVKEHPEIIVVAPNYRIGVLGNLNLSAITGDEDYKYSNNLALLDLIAALRWVQKNIAAFGGDADCVTMYGHSAGSNAISHLLTIPEAAGLFKRAICQSSFMTEAGTVEYETSEHIAEKFWELTKVQTLEQAKALTREELLDAQKKLFQYHYRGKPSKMFSPVIDGVLIKDYAFKNFVNGEINAEELMIGFSEGEIDQMFFDKNEEEILELLVARNRDKGITEEDAKAYAGLHPEKSKKEAYMSFHNMLHIIFGGELIARACASHIPVYEYLFQLRNKEKGWRALHGDPCYYVFGTLTGKEVSGEFKKTMMDTFAAFMRTGNPGVPSVLKWPEYSENGSVMCIDEQWKVNQRYWEHDYEFLAKWFAVETELLKKDEKGED